MQDLQLMLVISEGMKTVRIIAPMQIVTIQQQGVIPIVGLQSPIILKSDLMEFIISISIALSADMLHTIFDIFVQNIYGKNSFPYIFT